MMAAYNAADEAQAELILDRVRALLPRFAAGGTVGEACAEQLREALDGKGAGPARRWRRYVDDGGPARNAHAAG